MKIFKAIRRNSNNWFSIKTTTYIGIYTVATIEYRDGKSRKLWYLFGFPVWETILRDHAPIS